MSSKHHMGETVLEVENLSKRYRLGTIGTGSLRQDLQHWWNKSVLRKKDPFFSAQEEMAEKNNQVIWALRDVSFRLEKGEALGIIGSNGSGKSTLLKIVSRIVQPTLGTVRGKGKVSSILEVGTGFHSELSGRENIYNSGYILGMNREEIRGKFDEIVAFSGIEKFIDTPVKRYSSGMYVRLAFAVAAHLEPDILIVDEVLAVGDADFQKKCMGKMQEVSAGNGRTILFVSHNMQAITHLCSRALWLDSGRIKKTGHPKEVVESYIGSAKQYKTAHHWDTQEGALGNDTIRMKSIEVRPLSEKPDAFITVRTPIELRAEFWCLEDGFDLNVNVRLLTATGDCVFDLGSPNIRAEKSIVALRSIIPGNLLNNASYAISLVVVRNNSSPIFSFSHCISFDVEDVREGMSYFGTWPGMIRPQIESVLFKKDPL
ncbi:MAG: ABC transporter ATP-binding protein [Flavisolibacter sp.]